MKQYIIFSILIFSVCKTYAQAPVTIKITDQKTSLAVPLVSVSENNKVLGIADSSGKATIPLNNGLHRLRLSSVGYKIADITIQIPYEGIYEIKLEPDDQSLDEVIISSTRNNQRIETSPLKVEVLGQDDMNEENTIKPGNIASILGDVSGIQIQQSSAVSGNANVRIQGLEGRYTQILRDGLPLFDGFSGGFGILSIPPLDLKQIELIKGSASTLYGGGAIGGLVNLISKKPKTVQEGTFTINQSTLNETNLNAFLSKRYQKVGYTFFSGYTHQKAVDVNKDGFSDLPYINSFIVHPRLFFYPDDKTTIITGYTGTFEKRNGGDMMVLQKKPDNLHQYFENNKTGRHSGELVIDRNLSDGKTVQLKSAVSSFANAVTSNSHYFNGRQINYFTELSALIPYNTNSFVAGVNIAGDKFTILPSDPVLLHNFLNNTVGAFIQNTWVLKENTTLEAGLRDDYHNKYGNFLLPRVAMFHKFNGHWGARLGAGMGYKTPNPLSPQIVDYAIEDIHELPAGIKAEKSIGLNAEGNYKKVWENGNEIFINHAFFLTQIKDPIVAASNLQQLVLSNASKPIITKGFDTYIQTRLSDWEIYCGFTYTIAERKYLPANQFMPLTPKERMAFTVVRDFANAGWRIGVEGSYNGPQYRFDATQTSGYFFAAAMVEKKIGKHFGIVLNGENLLDYRQSKKESLFTGTLTNPEFKPLWAPIDGRVINCSVKYSL